MVKVMITGVCIPRCQGSYGHSFCGNNDRWEIFETRLMRHCVTIRYGCEKCGAYNIFEVLDGVEVVTEGAERSDDEGSR